MSSRAESSSNVCKVSVLRPAISGLVRLPPMASLSRCHQRSYPKIVRREGSSSTPNKKDISVDSDVKLISGLPQGLGPNDPARKPNTFGRTTTC